MTSSDAIKQPVYSRLLDIITTKDDFRPELILDGRLKARRAVRRLRLYAPLLRRAFRSISGGLASKGMEVTHAAEEDEL